MINQDSSLYTYELFFFFLKSDIEKWGWPSSCRWLFFKLTETHIPDIERDGNDCVEDDDVGEEDQQGDGGGSFLNVSRFVCGAGNKAFPGEVNGELASNQGFPNTTGYGHC